MVLGFTPIAVRFKHGGADRKTGSDPHQFNADRRFRMTTADTLPAGLSPDLVVDFDIYDPNLTAPIDVIQERLAELAAKGPVVYSTAHGGHWIVTHYKD